MSEELAALRDRVPGCSVVAFADLSTGMVLASSTAEKTTQERLDALCAAGRDMLKGDAARHMAEGFCEAAPRVAIHACAGNLNCFIQAPRPAEEALCCVVSPQTPLSELLDAAALLLQRTVSEG